MVEPSQSREQIGRDDGLRVFNWFSPAIVVITDAIARPIEASLGSGA
jgi:hypothetical protein